MNYQIQTQEQFHVVGIEVRTTNENGQAMKDLPALWGRFYAEGIQQKIPHKINQEIICLYTEYEKDYTKPYTAFIGCKVDSIEEIPDGLVSKTIPAAKYLVFTGKGKVFDEVVKIWQYVWSKDAELNRAYTGDFEVYGEKTQNPEDGEVEVYIATQ